MDIQSQRRIMLLLLKNANIMRLEYISLNILQWYQEWWLLLKFSIAINYLLKSSLFKKNASLINGKLERKWQKIQIIGKNAESYWQKFIRFRKNGGSH